tara:strand:+ start:30 stop:287 length:258 start_codon:yes stop_codon:yes gene_type:complete
MKNYLDEIKNKLTKNIKIEKLEVVDNSHKHKGHRFYRPEKYHLKLKIKSLYLNSISRLKAHQEIMKILEDDLRKNIHALEINIEK